MNDLLILIHADPSVRPMFAREGLDVVAFVGPGVPGRPGGGLSSRYDALAASCKARRQVHGGRGLPHAALHVDDGNAAHVWLAASRATLPLAGPAGLELERRFHA